MKVTRGFQRISHDPPTPEEWTTRIDALLCAHPAELLEFVCDAILSLAARHKTKSLTETLDLLTTACSVPGTHETLEMIDARWLDIQATLGEHLDPQDITRRLAKISREAPWE